MKDIPYSLITLGVRTGGFPNLKSFLHLLIVILLFFSGLGAITTASATPIVIDTLPYQITQPGYYELGKDFSDYNPSGSYAIEITCNNVILDGNGHLLDGFNDMVEYGIKIDSAHNTDNITLKNFRLSDWKKAIYVISCDYINVEDNVIDSCPYGIQFSWVENGEIRGNEITNFKGGISLSDSKNIIIKDNIASSGQIGITICGSNNTIENNTANSNSNRGFSILGESGQLGDNVFVGNTANYNSKYGFVITGADNNILEDNVANHNKCGIGIEYNSGYGYYPENNQLSNNILLFNTEYGIRLSKSKNSVINGNNLSYNSLRGIHGEYVDGLKFYDNTVIQNSEGAYFISSNGLEVYNNLFNNDLNYGGSGATFNTTLKPGTNIIGGSLIGGNAWLRPDGKGFSQTCGDANGDGICDIKYQPKHSSWDYHPLSLDSGSPRTCNVITQLPFEITLSGSYCLETDFNDVNLGTSYQSPAIRIEASDVVLDGQGHVLDGIDEDYAVYVDGSPDTSNVEIKNIRLSEWNVGVFLIDGNARVENVTLLNCWRGVYIVSDNNEVDSVTIESSQDSGIFIWNSNGNKIVNSIVINTNSCYRISAQGKDAINNELENNSATYCKKGFYLEGASDNTLSSNSVTYSDNGFYLKRYSSLWKSQSNDILDNTVNHNKNGIYLREDCDGNTISGNTIMNNSNKGIFLEKSRNNLVYDNFLKNSANIFASKTYSNSLNTALSSGKNIIGGSLIGGNAWLRPDGKGFSQTCGDANGDGICDKKLWYNSKNIDNFPLYVSSDPPDTIQNLQNQTVECGVELTWDNPSDPDFNYVEVYIDESGRLM